MRKSIIFIFFLIFSSCVSIANSPIFKELEISNYYQDLSINTIAFDDNGYMYLGTNEGLFNYDGFKFNAIINSDKIKNITAIHFYQSKIFIGNKKGEIYVSNYKDDVQSFKLIATLESEISDIQNDLKGNVWVASLGSGLFKITNATKLQAYSSSVINSATYCYDLELAGNKLWIASDEGLFNIDEQAKLNTLENMNNVIDDKIITSLSSYNHQLYIGTESRGYFIFNLQHNKFQISNQLSQLGAVKNIKFHHEMLLMLTADSGLVNVNKRNEFNSFNKRNAKLSSSITDLIVDREGNVWLSTLNNKLISFNTLFQRLNITEKSNNILTVYRDKSNKLWFSDSKNIYVHQNKTTSKILSQLQNLNVVSIHEDEYGFIWFGTFDKGLIRYHPKKNIYKIFNIKSGLSNDNILSMASKNAVLWIATLGGVSKIDYSNELNAKYAIVNFEKEDGIGSNFIYQVFIDSKSRVWFATDGKGITVFENNKFKNYSKKEGLLSKTIYSITEDANGVLWLNTAKDGLVYFDHKVFKTFTRENGLRSYTNTSIVADNFENILVISNKGVDMININSKNIHYHDSELDFVNLEPNINAYHKPANDNEIWFASQNNIYVFYQGKHELWNGPKTILRAVKVNSDVIDHTLLNTFGYQQNYISFDVIGLWYHKPSEVKYMYKLEGYDVNWIQTTDNSINYSKLPPGNYVFKISSSANSKFKDNKVIEYSFTIEKPYWLRIWFILLVFTLLVLILFYFLKFRIKQLKRKEKYERDRVKFELDTLRNQINPHFLFNSFNTLMGLIEIDSERAVKYVEHLSDFYRELLNQRDTDVISLEREIELLKNYIYILDQRFENKLFVNIEIDIVYMNKSIAALSLQLLVENAIKHNEISRDYPLIIDINIENEFIVVSNMKRKHLHEVVSTKIGLNNIKNRYELLSKKQIEIIESDDKFTVKLPLID